MGIRAASSGGVRVWRAFPLDLFETRVVAASLLCLTMLAPAQARANEDLVAACQRYGNADAVFIGRAKDPIKVRISGEREIEEARQKWLRAKADLEEFRALKQLASVGSQRELERHLRLRQAQLEYDTAMGKFPPPQDLVFQPFEVEVAYLGVAAKEVLVWTRERPVEVGRSYLVSAQRHVLGPAAPDVLGLVARIELGSMSFQVYGREITRWLQRKSGRSLSVSDNLLSWRGRAR